jgi:hypothetical protein
MTPADTSWFTMPVISHGSICRFAKRVRIVSRAQGRLDDDLAIGHSPLKRLEFSGTK